MASGLAQLSAAAIDKFKEAEFAMAAQDRRIRELQEAKNDLEAYVYSMRERVAAGGDLVDYLLDADRAVLAQQMEEIESWLYTEEAEHAGKSQFTSRLEELRRYGGPAEERLREAAERPAAVAELEACVKECLSFSSSTDPAYDHITPDDRARVQKEAGDAGDWLAGKRKEQEGRGATEGPAVTAREIRAKRDALQAASRPIMTRPKSASKAKPVDPNNTAGAGAGSSTAGSGPEEVEKPGSETAFPGGCYMDEGLD